jgi:hypothetical protein
MAGTERSELPTLGADRQPDGLAGDPLSATGQPKPATYPAAVTGKQADAPARRLAGRSGRGQRASAITFRS